MKGQIGEEGMWQEVQKAEIEGETETLSIKP